MAQAIMLPAALFLVGLVAAMFFERPKHTGFAGVGAGAGATQPAPAAPLD